MAEDKNTPVTKSNKRVVEGEKYFHTFEGSQLDVEHWANKPKIDFEKQYKGSKSVRFDIDNTYNALRTLAKEKGLLRGKEKAQDLDTEEVL